MDLPGVKLCGQLRGWDGDQPGMQGQEWMLVRTLSRHKLGERPPHQCEWAGFWDKERKESIYIFIVQYGIGILRMTNVHMLL